MNRSAAEQKKTALRHLMETYMEQDLCLAFSGGVDSSLLLKTAAEAAAKTGKNVYAVTFNTRLHPACDLENAKKVAGELGGIHKIIDIDELEQEAIRQNPVNRCYLCKKHLFETLKGFAASQGVFCVMDGTNEDDLHVYRPGIQALRELGIISPLALLHITKEEVKAIAASYGISAASRPSTPCMATRLPYNTPIDYELLERMEEGEAYLRSLAGIRANVRLRLHGAIARIEVDKELFSLFLSRSGEITAAMKALGFTYITLDLEGFRSGSMDIGLE